jgi:hypothetical protein
MKKRVKAIPAVDWQPKKVVKKGHKKIGIAASRGGAVRQHQLNK